jgi:hypothetical protein
MGPKNSIENQNNFLVLKATIYKNIKKCVKQKLRGGNHKTLGN